MLKALVTSRNRIFVLRLSCSNLSIGSHSLRAGPIGPKSPRDGGFGVLQEGKFHLNVIEAYYQTLEAHSRNFIQNCSKSFQKHTIIALKV
ncbi:hypothetical protein HanIR_Chr03g0135101 [Helianthus annuus]|nr:hypothetical protein HanIR_Chr03g0135101 [Helianthus annuus]